MSNSNIVIACDGNYVGHAATCIASILSNSRSTVNSITLVLAGSATLQKERLATWARRKFGFEIDIVEFNLDSVRGLETKAYWSSATYIRYFLPTFVPDYEQVLYLDADTLVIGSLEGLSIPISGIESRHVQYAPLFAVSDENGKQQIPNLRSLGLVENRYFNAGVLLLDLRYWRQFDITEKLIGLSESLRGKIGFMDQDCLNLVYQGVWKEIDWIYNQHANKFDPSGAIVHFTGNKPTTLGNRHPARRLYLKYRRMTPYWFFVPELTFDFKWTLSKLRYKIQRGLNKTANLLGIRRRRNPS